MNWLQRNSFRHQIHKIGAGPNQFLEVISKTNHSELRRRSPTVNPNERSVRQSEPLCSCPCSSFLSAAKNAAMNHGLRGTIQNSGSFNLAQPLRLPMINKGLLISDAWSMHPELPCLASGNSSRDPLAVKDFGRTRRVKHDPSNSRREQRGRSSFEASSACRADFLRPACQVITAEFP